MEGWMDISSSDDSSTSTYCSTGIPAQAPQHTNRSLLAIQRTTISTNQQTAQALQHAVPHRYTHLQPRPRVALDKQPVSAQVSHVVEPHVGITCMQEARNSADKIHT